MEKRDLVLLLEAGDALCEMDKVLKQLTGLGYASGDFMKLDNVFQVILNNIHPSHRQNEMASEAVVQILLNNEIPIEQRMEILLNEVNYNVGE